MNVFKLLTIFLLLCSLVGCKRKKVTQDRLCSRINFEQIVQVIPKTSEEIYALTDQIIERMNQTMAEVDDIDAQQRTYVNTLLAYEQAYFQFFMHKQIFTLLAQLSSDRGLQTAANVGLLELMDYQEKQLNHNPIWFQVMQEYEKFGKDPYRNIKPVSYFLNVQLEKGLRYGLHLDVEKLAQVMELEQEIKKLAARFYHNVMHDQKYIMLQEQDALSMPESFLKSLNKDEQGQYKISVDEKNYDCVMKFCKSSTVRRDFFQLFHNRGYPQNEIVLSEIHALYQKLALQLQFENIAELQLDDCMVHSAKKIETLLLHFSKDLQGKTSKRISLLKQRLPIGVSLNPCGQIQPWDFDFVCASYAQSVFDIHDAEVAAYFAVPQVCDALLKQFGTFFHVSFEVQESANVWAEGVVCYRVRSLKHQGVIGYLFFDLYKRATKREGPAYASILIPAIRDDCSIPCVGASVVVANFDSHTLDNPALLTFDQLYDLTYQLGVAFHNIFGSTRFTQFSGNQVSADFAQVPSELLVRWLMQPNFLQVISSHYQHHHHLDKRTIEKLIARAQFQESFRIEQLIMKSLVALKFFDSDAYNFNKSMIQLQTKILPYLAIDPQNHFYCSFHWLVDVNLGALFFASVWSKIIAADCFEEIKKSGLLNHETGMRFVTEVLGHGASKHPVEMVKKFLNRSVHKSALINQL